MPITCGFHWQPREENVGLQTAFLVWVRCCPLLSSVPCPTGSVRGAVAGWEGCDQRVSWSRNPWGPDWGWAWCGG